MERLPTLPASLVRLELPPLVAQAGHRASERVVEFFVGTLRNSNTRAAYWHACTSFLRHCESFGTTLEAIRPLHVAAYVEQLSKARSAPTVKQQLAAIRRLFDFLVIGQVLPSNPAAAVRAPKHVVTEGKTPILSNEEVRLLFASFDPGHIVDLRDRALIAIMVYGFARVSAVARMRVRDFYRQSQRAWFVFDEKGGRQNKVPAHRQAARYVEAYLAATGFADQRQALLFRSIGRTRPHALTERGLRREEIYQMVRRRTAAVGLPPEIGCHSFRGTGITNFLDNGGTIQEGALLAGHASILTTQLYDRRRRVAGQVEIDRLAF